MLAAQILKKEILENYNLLEKTQRMVITLVEQKMHHLVSSFLVIVERQFLSTFGTQAQ